MHPTTATRSLPSFPFPALARSAFVLLALSACGGAGKKERSREPEPAPATKAEPAPAPAPAPQVTPEELYAKCKDRMENPEEAGECKVDADCASAGCNQEVCTTVAKSKEWNTACDQQPCFQVADACGCHDGKCTWTLKKEVPAGSGLGNRLPPSLPPTEN
jgi:eight-cysteine-cluster-containing protein